VCTKDPCWFVGTIYDPRELPGVGTTGPGIGRGVTTKMDHHSYFQVIIISIKVRWLPHVHVSSTSHNFCWALDFNPLKVLKFNATQLDRASSSSF
jgi:hypothetical protein